MTTVIAMTMKKMMIENSDEDSGNDGGRNDEDEDADNVWRV